MRLLVCGGREFREWAIIWDRLSKVHQKHGVTLLIHGGASGADTFAGEWAKDMEIPVQVYQADWERYGKGAGPIRNQQMLDEGKPNAVVAFPGGSGTADMVRRAKAAGLAVWEVIP